MSKIKCTRCYRAVPILFSGKFSIDSGPGQRTDFEIKLCDVCTERALRSAVHSLNADDYTSFIKAQGKIKK